MRRASKENFKSLNPKSATAWPSPRIPWQDMAMVLSGVDDIVSKYARLKYAGQQLYFQQILIYVYKEILGMGWKFPNKDFPKRLAALALREAVMSDMCPRCNGKGEISTGMKIIECFSCDGSGILRRTEKFRASFMQMHRNWWNRRWRTRFNREIMSIFDLFENDIEVALRKRLR